MTRIDEQLSAYLDGALRPAERARLEARLAADPALRERLESLRRTVALVRDLPLVPTPRNFLLTPAMVAPTRPRPAPRRWLVPALSFSTALSGILCVIALAALLLSANPAHLLTGPAPAAPTYEVALEGSVPTEAPLAAVAVDQATEVAPTGRAVPPPSATVTDSAELLQVAPSAPVPPPSAEVGWTATNTMPVGIGGGGGELPPAPLPPPTPTAPPTVEATTAPAIASEPALPEAYQATPEPPSPPPSPLRWLLVVGLALFTLGLAATTVMTWKKGRQGDKGTR